MNRLFAYYIMNINLTVICEVASSKFSERRCLVALGLFRSPAMFQSFNQRTIRKQTSSGSHVHKEELFSSASQVTFAQNEPSE